jgi:non-specific serine/threonine protein kinase
VTGALLDKRAGNLPADVTRFIGRAGELAEAKRLLETSRLVSLVGVSGVGKSRLALRIAADTQRAFADGAWIVELSGLRDPELLAHAVGNALHVAEQSARDPVDLLVDFLEERQLLLILDTCEHLIDACAMLAEVLLRAAPRLHVIATSREALDVPGEYLMQLSPLSAPDPDGPLDDSERYDAVTLFLDRAAAVAPGFAMHEANRRTVVRLCHRLDGIPLAIELAASRLRAMSIEQILERLDDRFRLLGSARTSQTRHQTLLAAVGWSYELCTPGERSLWERLSVFPGAFELAAAERICADEELAADAVFETLARLVEKSIVHREPVSGRYRMLDTLREYGADRLSEHGRTAELRRRHSDWVQEIISSGGARDVNDRQIAWFAELQRAHADIRVALEYSFATPGEAETGVRMAANLWGWWFAGMYAEGRHWLDLGLAQVTEPSTVRAWGLFVAGTIAALCGDTTIARRRQQEAEELARELGDDRGIANALGLDGLTSLSEGALDRSVERLSEAVEVKERLGGALDFFGLLNLCVLGCAHGLRGEIDVGMGFAERIIGPLTGSGERLCLSYALCLRGWSNVQLRRYDLARADAEEALRLKHSINDVMGRAIAIDILAACADREGDVERAAILFGATEKMCKKAGAPMMGRAYLVLRDGYEAAVRGRLEPAIYSDARGVGAAMPVDRVVAYALGEPEPEQGGTVAGVAVGDPGGPLTPRERQIADLVVEGLSSREIADRLFIAKRTVDSHVEHIFAKLSVGSRAQLAAWVVGRR